MGYTNKQIKRILVIQELVESVNTLARVYEDFDDKEFSVNSITDKKRIYKIYCSSIYNMILGIQGSKEFFEKTSRYKELEELLEQKLIANDSKYYKKDNYESTLFKVIETIRHQLNHYAKDDDDNNMLFEVYVDYKALEKLRIILNDIFYEIYNQIDKEKIKRIILSKPKVQYSYNRFVQQLDEMKNQISNTKIELNKIFQKESERSINILKELLDNDFLYDLISGKQEAIRKLELMDSELEKYYNEADDYIKMYGSEFEKESLELIEELIRSPEPLKIKDININISNLQEKIQMLLEKYNKKI
jgi:CII-binding regulator of phage lambda lysogenization HflD